jgi:hypothetical protein
VSSDCESPDDPSQPLDYAEPDTPRPPLHSDDPETLADVLRALGVVMLILVALFLIIAMFCGGLL